ncbi:MAG TPA: MarC family protein [bacterium]|nr:MarC family protein [bacterium]
MTIFSAAMLLFLVMDPFGNIPLFMTAMSNVDPARHNRVIARELLIALGVLVVFLFLGQYLLKLLQISGDALNAAGGVVLLLIAIKMVFPRRGGLSEELPEGEPFIVPLAIPYVAGPSAMASVMLIMNREPGRWPEWLMAVLIAWVVSGAIIASSGAMVRLLGKRALIALERLMGMLLVAVAVQMLLSGVVRFFDLS